MNISFSRLRKIKHQLPTGSIKQIAKELSIKEQTVRNYFGANKFNEGDLTGKHIQQGPNGGLVKLVRTDILDLANKILRQKQAEMI